MTTVGVLALARVTFDLDIAARRVEEAWSTLMAAGVELAGSSRLLTDAAAVDEALDDLLAAGPDVIVILQATFADATMTVRIHERAGAIPLVCWSFPEERTGEALRLNSLCGANLAAYSLRRRDSAAAFVHLAPDRCDASERVALAIAEAQQTLAFEWAVPAGGGTTPADRTDVTGATSAEVATEQVRRVVEALAGTTIGVIGDHPPGFEPCAYDAATVAALTGAAADRVELADLFGAADEVTPDELTTIRRRCEQDLTLPDALRDTGLDQSLRLYGGLRRLSDERAWGAVATRCWPECTRDYGGAACAPQAMLTADGVPAMCEADVYGGLTALVLRTISGADPFVTDVVDFDSSDGTSVVWHCGQAPLSLADRDGPRRGIDHPMQGRALLHEFALRPGRVTIARLSQARGRPSMVVGGGELLARPRPFTGTCGVLRWDLPVEDVMRTIFDVGLEHHVAIVPGEHRDTLVALAEHWDIPVVRLGHDRGERAPVTAASGATDAGLT